MILRFLLLTVLLIPPVLSHALTTDRGRPFGAGEILGFPGADYFVGDLSHDLAVTDPYRIREPLGSWPQGSLLRLPPFGIGSGALLFEGSACPLPSRILGGIQPGGAGTLESHDFPAGAWWGPAAAEGALQLRAPNFDPDTPWVAGAWGGVPDSTGAQFRFPGYLGTMAGVVRPKGGRADGTTDAWTVTGRGRRDWKGDTRLAGGFLDARTRTGGRWTSLYGEVRSGVGHFNEWLVKPVLQSASGGGLTAREAGLEARTLFNMAGFVESQWAAGADRTVYQGREAPPSVNRAFLQNTESFDALGIVLGDLALRCDFAEGSRPRRALAAGMQGHYGAAGLLASGERSDGWDSHSRQNRWGLRFTPGDFLDAMGYLLEGSSPVLGGFHGPGAVVKAEGDASGFPGLRRLSVRVEGRSLLTHRRARTRDAAGELLATLVTGSRLVLRGAARVDEKPSGAVGVEQPLGKGLVLDFHYARSPRAREEEAWTIGLNYAW